MLYPLKFIPILKPASWGGKFPTCKENDAATQDPIGENWAISGVQENLSVVAEGTLAENTLEELIEVYMGDLVGDKVYQRFGVEFPLLVKFINTHERLPLQVHPDDRTAKERHRAYGKNKMWYVLEAPEKAEITAGFKEEIDSSRFLSHQHNHTLTEILHTETVHKNDCFFIPARTVYSISAGCLLVAIEQTSDITYYLEDCNQADPDVETLQLDTALALDSMDFTTPEVGIHYHRHENHDEQLVECPWFTANYLKFDKEIEKDYIRIDSFVIYVCLSGSFSVVYDIDQSVKVNKGETVLVPACLKDIFLIPDGEAEILEAYIA